jgi:hypothetical protein
VAIRINDISLHNNRIGYSLVYPRSLRKYLLRPTFFVQYDKSIDLKNTDASLLAIPIVANIAPVAWALGADIEIESLDMTFFHSLVKIKALLGQWYPQLSSSSELHVKRLAVNRINGSRTGMLFSGGVDAFATYARNRALTPDLISVWDCEPRLHEHNRWKDIQKRSAWVQERDPVQTIPVKCNLNYFNGRLLGYRFGLHSWYEDVAHGMQMLGICAPISGARGYKSVLIAASCSTADMTIGGNHHALIESFAWADVVTSSEGIDMSRQQKIEYLAKNSPATLTQLRVCHISSGKNCSGCEKCFRTITGLSIAGIDPEKCGFKLNTATFRKIKKALDGKYFLDWHVLVFWADLQKHLPEHIENDFHGSKEFLTWFRQAELKEVSGQPPNWLWNTRYSLVHLITILRNLPVAPVEVIKYFWYLTQCHWHLTLAKIAKAGQSHA